MRFALLALLLLSTALPGPREAAAAPPEDAAGKARYALVGAIETLDPPRAESVAARTCVANVFDQLYEYEHVTRPYRLKPCLAATLPEISKDGRVHTIRIRKGVRFVDDACFEGGKGREVTAGDVVFCLLRLMDARIESPGRWMFERRIVGLDAFTEASRAAKPDPARGAYTRASGLPAVPGLEVVDRHTFRVRLIAPMPELPWLLASPWTSIYAPESVVAYGTDLGRHAVGTGPFRLTLYLKQDKLLLQSNPTYREDHYPTEGDARAERSGLMEDAGRPLPRNAQIEVTAYESDLAAWAAFLNADVDMAEIPRDALQSAVDLSRGTLLPFLAQRGVRLHRDARLEVFYDAFNWEDPVVGRKAGERGRAIRRAICLATDDQWALTRLYTNHAERVYGPLLPEMRGFDPGFRHPWQPRPDETSADTLDLARDVLAEAGMPEGRGIPTLRMHVLDDAMSKRVFEIQRDQVAKIGVRLESVVVTWPQMQEALKTKSAQMWTSSWYADYPDSQNFLQLFYGPNGPEPNYTNYHNPEFDELYLESRLLAPGRDRDDLYRLMQDLVTDDCIWRFRFRRQRWAASQPWLHGYKHNDVVPKYFKYCRADEAVRLKAVEALK